MIAKSKERVSYLCNEQHMSDPSLEMFFLLEKKERKMCVIMCFCVTYINNGWG